MALVVRDSGAGVGAGSSSASRLEQPSLETALLASQQAEKPTEVAVSGTNLSELLAPKDLEKALQQGWHVVKEKQGSEAPPGV